MPAESVTVYEFMIYILPATLCNPGLWDTQPWVKTESSNRQTIVCQIEKYTRKETKF